MKSICVLQHVEAEFLGLIEDHLEARAVRFRYCRPFVAGGKVPAGADGYDGLIVLGAGPFGMVSGPLLPTLAAELRLTTDFLQRELPVIGIGLGAVILSTAAGGGAVEAPLRFKVEKARRVSDAALAGHLPPHFPMALYLRDRPALPAAATVLAESVTKEPLLFEIASNAFGFVGHPGIKSAMVEDLAMEFDEVPEGLADGLVQLREQQAAIAAALSEIMVGLIQQTDWMAAQ
jgi:GMP synthase-like glutamine amidotransferase